MELWQIICVIGIALNWMLLIGEISKSPEGAMGAAIPAIVACVPYLLVGIFIYVRIRDEIG